MRNITKYVIYAAAVILVVYDVYAVMTGGVKSSISHVIIEAAYEMPSIAFGAGFLCGHLFWKIRPVKKES